MITKQRRDEILKRLQEMKPQDGSHRFDNDPESSHSEADDLLLELIDDPRVTEAFNAIEKWYA